MSNRSSLTCVRAARPPCQAPRLPFARSGEHETSWHRLLTCLREHVATQPSNAATRKDLEMVEAKWRDIRLAFKAKGLLQPRALILDTGASHPQWCELAFSTPWLRPFHRLLQLIPVEARTRLFPRWIGVAASSRRNSTVVLLVTLSKPCRSLEIPSALSLPRISWGSSGTHDGLRSSAPSGPQHGVGSSPALV